MDQEKFAEEINIKSEFLWGEKVGMILILNKDIY